MNHEDTAQDLILIAANCVQAKCSGNQDGLLYWSSMFVKHPHAGPAKDIFFDMLTEPLGVDAEFYLSFIEALEGKVS